MPINLSFFSLFPENRSFSYEAKTCTFGAFFPSLHSYSQGETELYPDGTVRIGSFPLFARRLCLAQNSPPKENSKTTIGIRYFRIPFYQKRISVHYGNFPSLSPSFNTSEPVSILQPLRFALSGTDNVFNYHLVIGEQETTCEKSEKEVLCDLQNIKLKHGSTHEYKLMRVFEGEGSAVAATGNINILEPVVLSQDFVGVDAVFYQSPTELILKANKALSQDEPQVSLFMDGDPQNKVSGAVIKDSELHLSLLEPLKRKTSYTLEVASVAGSDGSTLESPYKLTFTTSGGPKVSGISIRNVSVNRASDPILTFDQTLLGKDFSTNISLLGGTTPLGFSSRVADNRLTIIPHDYLPFCSTVTISLNEKIESQFGVSGDSTYTFSFRTTCFRTVSIGTSVKGRAITAYYFGYGSTMLLYIGAMHGGELSSKYIMDSWISDLDANYPSIPQELTLVIAPSSNPDGVAAGSRLNANGVDLNRNFPTSDWRPDISTSPSSYLPQGGGSAPLSEPESKALADFIGSHRPRLTFSFHSQGSYVIANDGGDSRAQASRYSELTGYRYFDSDNYSEAFEYNVTGTLDDWMRQAYGLSELLIELPGHSGNYFNQNKQALWKTLDTR